MGTFNVSSKEAFQLSKLNEDVITIKKITSSDKMYLHNLIIICRENLSNKSITSQIPTFNGNIISNPDGKTEVNLNYKITNCSKVTLEVQSPINEEYEIYYETLADKLEYLNKKEEDSRTNIQEELRKWKNSVNNLYHAIRSWSSPYDANIEIINSPIKLTEPAIGTYDSSILTVKPKFGKTLEFRPVGTYILGAHGRIDVFIPFFGREIMLLLNRKDGIDKWLMVFNKNIQSHLAFDKAQFINLLDEVISL